MKYVKMLGLLAVAAAAMMAFAGTASANPSYVTSPAGTVYTGHVHAVGHVTSLHNAVTTVTCANSTVTGNITQHKGSGTPNTAGGPVTTLTFSNCNYPVTVLKPGSLTVQAIGGGNGTVRSTGAEITIHGPFGVNCIYTTSNTHVGTLTGGAAPVIDINSAAIPRTGHSAFCGSSGNWTGSYTITTPKPLFIS